MADDNNIAVPAVWFYIIWCLLIILILLVVFLLILLSRMKSKMYEQLKEPNDSAVTRTTTINSNRYNIQLDYRKESDRLLRLCDNFSLDDIELPSPNNTVEENAPKEKTQKTVERKPEVEVNNDKFPKIKQAILPPLLLRQQMEQICNELLNSRMKMKSIDKDTVEESYELKDLSAIKKRIKSFRASTRVRSKSTTDLDIYDVLPNPHRVFKFNSPAKEDEKYSSVRNDGVVIVNDESGYLLPLSVKTSYYSNSNTK